MNGALFLSIPLLEAAVFQLLLTNSPYLLPQPVLVTESLSFGSLGTEKI